MATTRTGIDINAPRAVVYQLLLDGDAVKAWMMPDGTSEVHRFEPKEGGTFSITTTYAASTDASGTEPQHDAYYGRFTTLIPDEKIVEVLEFVTEKPDISGAQMVAFTLSDTGNGTRLDIEHTGVPSGLSQADNEASWQLALTKLRAMAEGRA
ncbi:activator of HSP90 ATPase [Nocardia mangyaensis]|uniref:Activator of HSP90 ATPase n=1 Tax=Nocardia mangyaensis TaxID=2213200 RepID=A0A1J0VQ97_9NOCA|nr:SRPBCC domain-containing protein [Nocardia mangyaensis]APE34135.1 activator of HSP90 ATPase [Nocardia mangyaensis]